MSVRDQYVIGSGTAQVIVREDDLLCHASDYRHDFKVTVQFNEGPTFTRSLDPKEPQASVIISD